MASSDKLPAIVQIIDQPSEVSAGLLLQHEAILLPSRVEGSIGTYDEGAEAVFKAFRAEGIDVAYAHDAEHRRWLHLMGEDIVLTLVLGIASNAAWYILHRILSRQRNHTVHVKIARIAKGATANNAEWFEAHGEGPDVARALDTYFGGDTDEPDGD